MTLFGRPQPQRVDHGRSIYLAPSEFGSDHERRTLGFVAPGRDTLGVLTEALAADPYTVDPQGRQWPASERDVGDTLKDLESRGLVERHGHAWRVTKAGKQALRS